jgi:uncharacterized membrane protein
MNPTAPEASPFNDWRLVALSPLPTWALALLAFGAAAAVYFAWRGLEPEGRSHRRFTLISLRGLAAVLAFLLVLEPGIELLATTKLRGRVAVLVDQSKSMSLPARAGGPTRADVAATLIGNSGDRASLESRFQVEYYGFGEGLWPLDTAALTRKPKGDEAAPAGLPSVRDAEHSYLLPALEEAARSGGSRPLAGVVLITDGADNGVLAEGLDATNDKAKAEDLRERLKAIGAPVFALDVTGGVLKDISIAAVKVDDFAFVRNTVDVEVDIAAHGFGAKAVKVSLERQGQLVSSAPAQLKEDGTTRVKLPFVPDTTGEFAYTVRVPVEEGEAVTANNSRSFVLKVIRDRVRVLHVAGRPSYDERFLRSLLKRDPNVDLISFFILRTPTNLQNAPQEELSLIPFPTDEIFSQQIKSFDLVVFHNFNFRPYRMEQYLAGIAAYVVDGGAIMMIGGDNSFGEGQYHDTPIEEVLPVTFDGKPVPAGEEPFQPRVTAEGRRHPITDLVPDESQNLAAWQGLPQVNGLNHTTVKQDAQVLLEHPTLTDSNGRPLPVVAVTEVGRGRSMAITTDQSWMWSFVSARNGRPQRYYDDFFHNAIRWLVRDPELTQVRLQAEKERFSPSESAAFIVKARSRDYGPAAGARVHLDIENSETGQIVKSAEADVSTDGTARLETGALPSAPYRALATVRKDGAEVGQAEAAIVVEESGPELSRPAPRPDILRFIADATRGQTMSATDATLSSLKLKDPERVEIGQRKSRPLWDQWPILLLMCLVLGSEWFLRRRWGFF